MNQDMIKKVNAGVIALVKTVTAENGGAIGTIEKGQKLNLNVQTFFNTDDMPFRFQPPDITLALPIEVIEVKSSESVSSNGKEYYVVGKLTKSVSDAKEEGNVFDLSALKEKMMIRFFYRIGDRGSLLKAWMPKVKGSAIYFAIDQTISPIGADYDVATGEILPPVVFVQMDMTTKQQPQPTGGSNPPAPEGKFNPYQ